MAVAFEPVSPWHWFAAAAFSLLLVILAVGMIRGRWRPFGDKASVRGGVGALSILSATLLLLAAMNPVLRLPPPVAGEWHVSVVLDVSDSVRRQDPQLSTLKAQLRAQFVTWMRSVSDDSLRQAKASLITFRGNAAIAGPPIPLADFVRRLDALSATDFAGGDGSNLQIGLERAIREVDAGGGRGIVILASDGFPTTGDVLIAARDAAKRGIQVSTWPVDASPARLSILSSFLPGTLTAGEAEHLRSTVLNAGATSADATLTVEPNARLASTWKDAFGAQTVPIPRISFDANSFAAPDPQILFRERGLQFLDFTVSDENGVANRRRLFTNVTRPPRILAIAGGDDRWQDALPKGFAEIVRASPEQITSSLSLSQFEAVVISAIPAARFSPAQQNILAQAVLSDGVGMLLMNGSHAPNSEETLSLLGTYSGTVLAQVMPVVPVPRPYAPEPPPRQVVVILDQSGSMFGDRWRMQKAQELLSRIVEDDKLMRPIDKLDFITFGSNAIQVLRDLKMDASGKTQAMGAIRQVGPGGGTEPGKAFDLLRGRTLDNCGLIFITDGEFDDDLMSLRPDCRITVLLVGTSIGRTSPVYAIADKVETIQPTTDPTGITIPFFQPPERTKYFENGQYSPLPYSKLGDVRPISETPKLSLDGAAVTYPKEGVDVLAVRPKTLDPILVFGTAGSGQVGVFTTAIPDAWLAQPAGRAAVRAWLSRVMPFTDPDHYRIRVTDDGARMMLRVEVAPSTIAPNRIPRLDAMTAEVQIGQLGPRSFQLRPIDESPGAFEVELDLPRGEFTERAWLVLRESGPDAASRPQRIPLLVPYRSAVSSVSGSEDLNSGRNAPLLRELAAFTGGKYLDVDTRNQYELAPIAMPPQRSDPLWPWLVSAAVILYVVGIAIGRLEER